MTSAISHSSDASLDRDDFVSRLLESQRGIYAVLVAMLPHDRDLDDLFQKVCLALWQERAKYDPSRPFLPWAYAFTRNVVRAHLRANSRDRRAACLAPETLERIVLARSEIEATAEARRAALEACVEKLPPRQLALIQARYEGAQSLAELALGMKVSAAALTMRLQRIRHALLKCIERTVAAGEAP
ncbi:MAG: sigma-70 family RNA polymerase sigma factor [Planctomycetota bacterium]